MLKKLLAKWIGGTPEKKKKARKKTPSHAPKKSAVPLPKNEIGRVVAFFRIPVVAVIRVTKGPLKTNDQIWIKGHTTDLKLAVISMQMDHQPISEARKGEEVGIKVPSRTRIGDKVYRVAAS